MKDYIQWFMEIYLGDCYIDKESFVFGNKLPFL